jgi:hypothetical protein
LAFRRRLTIWFALVLFLALAGAAAFWRWKASTIIAQRIERLTGHRTTIASLSLNHRLELVARDVRIAGSPPFDSQTLARAAEVVISLRGPAGFWSPSAIAIDGLDIEYLGTTAGDNLRGLASPATKPGPLASNAGSAKPPRITARNARLRGTLALPHGAHVAFRVPQIEFDRGADGKLLARLHRVVVDVEGLASLRALAMTVDYDRERLVLKSTEAAAVDIPGGGALFENLALGATIRRSQAAFELHGNGADPVTITGSWSPGAIALKVSASEVPLRALGALATSRALGLENAKASLHASLAVDRPGLRAEYALDGKVQGIDIMHPAVDAVPWRNQSASFELRGSFDLASGRAEISSGSLKALAATLSLSGSVEISRSPHGALTLATPRHAPLSCASLFLGQPPPIQQALAGLELDGKVGFATRVRFDASAWEDVDLDVSVAPLCLVRREATTLDVLLPTLRQPTAGVHVPTKLPLGPFHPDFVSLASMPRHLPAAFLTSEDSSFYHHHGFDLEMIRRALAQDLGNRSFQRGASTITQQLAKNLFLTHRRTLARKLEEAVLTWRLEELLSKDRLLELYLNVIELGPGIRGVKQAAREWFGKEVAALTPLESAHLAALTPNPHVLARRFRDGQVDEGWQQRLYDLLGMMKRHGRLSSGDLLAARGSKLVVRELTTR